ncbi:hypothetical protein AVEN_149013-1 [Araneus ventricosus]|uniref:Uncharacterized protein n=1 Tax=Araneus ventricosus TaxID=182803 RepID=A0A4Y2SBQ1_ARAVE|nr:hypothetical protein AVEN_132851-1 [Araneus ventricosus]GBN85186.1 hypothetical protein AVEN_149013-1 [Araneus ventricosus]
MVRNCLIHKNLKFKLIPIETNLRPRCEGSNKTKDLPTLAPRVEAGNETRNPPRPPLEIHMKSLGCYFEPCLKTDFGTTVNTSSNCSTKMGEKKQYFGQMA